MVKYLIECGRKRLIGQGNAVKVQYSMLRVRWLKCDKLVARASHLIQLSMPHVIGQHGSGLDEFAVMDEIEITVAVLSLYLLSAAASTGECVFGQTVESVIDSLPLRGC